MTILIGSSIQQCSVGCLRCNNQNQCLLCDITNGYQLAATTCKLNTQTNCALLSQSGNCVTCNNGFYLDVNSQSCLAIPTGSAISNCQVYNSAQACVSCQSNFWLSGGSCQAVNSTIANCKYYVSNGACRECLTGFVLSNDLTVCVALPSNNNCLSYTYIGCRLCNSGFIINQNNYFTSFSSASFANSLLANMAVPVSQWVGLSVCQAVTLTNCAVFSAYNFCSRCNANYYLSNGACVAFPLNPIFGCATYTALNVCSSCQSGMYLSQNTCVPNTVIVNCASYSTSASTTTCVGCNSGFFLIGNGCSARVTSTNIGNCQVQNPAADLCLTCQAGFQLTSDSLACLAVVSNCLTYSTSTFQTPTLQCSLCNNGFYLFSSGTSVTCTSGSVLNCQTYLVSQNTCTVCNNGYYLNNGVCTAHVNIANCVVYDGVRSNTCQVCGSGFFKFGYTSVCVPTTVRANCAAYTLDGNSCTTCAPNYYLVSGACNTIPSTFANCNNFSGNACTLCNAGYMVNTLPVAGTCVLPLDYINSSINSPCWVMTPIASTLTPIWVASPSNTQTLLTCTTCNSYMYGYDPQPSEAICVNQSQLTMYSGFVSIANCKRYGLNFASSPTVVCMECTSGFFIVGYQWLGVKSSPYLLTTNTQGIQCSSTCTFASTSSSAVIPDDFHGFVNICVTATAIAASNTAQAALSLVQFLGTCQRYGRYMYTANDFTVVSTHAAAGADAAAAQLRMMNKDFRCIVPAPSAAATTSVPTNFLAVDDSVTVVPVDAATFAQFIYHYEPALSNGRNSEPVYSATGNAWDYNLGYSNTVDSSSTVPTVFNYKGILERVVILTAPAAGAALTAALAGRNSLAFCDIMHKFDTTGTLRGHAYGSAVANTFYTALAAPAAATYNLACLRCQFGYQLSYSPVSVANSPVFPSCVSMQNCASSTTVYGGLTTFLNSVYSCHLCGQTSGTTTFPTIWVELDAFTTVPAGATATFVGWTLYSVYTSASAVTTNHGFRCAAPPSSVRVSSTATGSVSNCAGYAYVTPITTSGGAAVSDTENALCVACAANTYPIYAGLQGTGLEMLFTNGWASTTATARIPGWAVTQCASSSNCDTTLVGIFNGCVKCDASKENSIPAVYYGFTDYTMVNCFPTTTQNCFILVTTASSTAQNLCLICKAGFVLNQDSVCEKYNVPNQSITSSSFTRSYFVSQVFTSGALVTLAAVPTMQYRVASRLHYLLSYNQLQYGVSSCQTGWLQFPANTWAPRICVFSSYIYNNTNGFPTTTMYINNCLKYNVTMVSGRNVCGDCNTGFIPTIDGSSCVSSTPLPNCRFAQSGANTALCYQCLPNFFNVNGQCVNTPIANCASYANNQWSFVTPSVLQCATCLNGFVLSSDALSCTSGRVNFCMTYQQGQPTICTACQHGYSLLSLTNNLYYCYPFPASLNCAQLQSTSSNSGTNLDTISCALCNFNSVQVFGVRSWNVLGLVNQAQSLCMPFNLITNCAVYDQGNLIITSNTFGCTQCITGFWYSAVNKTCVARVNNPSQCTTYSLTSDTCVTCGSGSFLNAAGTNCVPFPNGIFMCAQYSSATTCTQCQSGFYLSSNSCVQSTLVQNCAVYTANYTCSSCNYGFYLFNSSSCVSPSASNCLTYTSNTACASCRPGSGLQTTNGITSCVSNILSNCVNATSVAPFTCLVCNVGYFPNANGLCTVASTSIVNCLTYDTASTCSSCAPGTVLNVPRTSCNSTFYSNLIDPNCQQSFLMSSPSCTVCSLGTFFVNGTCASCTNNTFASGCLSCDPTNQNSCLVCRPNYYMNAVGACISVAPNVPSGNNTTPNNTASVRIATAIAASLSLVSLYFDQL